MIYQPFAYVSHAVWSGTGVQRLAAVSMAFDADFQLDRVVIQGHKLLVGLELVAVFIRPDFHVPIGQWRIFPSITIAAGSQMSFVWNRDPVPWWKFWITFRRLRSGVVFEGRKVYRDDSANADNPNPSMNQDGSANP